LPFTIRTKNSRNFYSSTSKLDIVLFICSLGIALWSLTVAFTKPSRVIVNSVAIGLAVSLDSKITVVKPIIMLLWNFFNRDNFFEIIKSLDWIDEKVNIFCM
jgi:hypothetical protein